MKQMTRRTLPLLGVAVVLAACLLAAGCTGQAPDGTDNKTEWGIDLNGTSWDLTSYAQNGSMKDVLADTPVTLVFGENATASGSAGCNSYSTTYTLNKTAGITFGPTASTLMYCPQKGVMEQESTYLGLLETVRSLKVEDENMTFFDGKGTAVLVFKTHVPPEPEPLVGTEWELQWYHDGDAIVSVIAGTEVTAVFDDEGKVAGSAGCNRYFASYEVDGTEMSIGPAGTTLRACMNEDIAEQERTYLALLNTTTSFAIEGDRLSLMDENGTAVLVFVKTEGPTALPLVGTTWVLDTYHLGDIAVRVIEGTEITAVFGEDGKLTGSGGCNNYFATYNVSGSSLTFGPAGSTKKICAEPEGIMEQEERYLSILKAVRSYEIEGNQLELLDMNGWRIFAFNAKV